MKLSSRSHNWAPSESVTHSLKVLATVHCHSNDDSIIHRILSPDTSLAPPATVHIAFTSLGKQILSILQLFFVLRKKENQVTILHLYHHTVTPLETWVCVKFIAGEYWQAAQLFEKYTKFPWDFSNDRGNVIWNTNKIYSSKRN